MRVFATCLVLLSAQVCHAERGAEDLFESEAQRAGFMRALADKDTEYDPAERMLAGRFSSPGYHTTLKDGVVHRTRNSLAYAVALFDSGESERIERGKVIVRRVIALQDQDPASRTYGIWSWFLEEPLDKMSPPDWNWADFCGTQLLQIAIEHGDKLESDLQKLIKESILHACRSIKRRDVKPGYTNIAIMGTYVTLAAGELYGDKEIFDYGMMRLRRFYDYTMEKGSFSEYNSPTYSVVAIKEISRMIRHVRHAEARPIIDRLNRFAWKHVARHFHPPTQQWAGPHSRCYRTLISSSTLGFIQGATAGKVSFVSAEQMFESLDAHRLGAECPPELIEYFTTLDTAREEIEAFVIDRDGPYDIIGTTWLHPEFTIGSVNIGDLWNQRMPVLAYWKTAKGAGDLRLRCLHDGYDYSSASIFTVQDKGDVLAAIVFATDRGDTHISLDRIKDGTVRASDLRVRVQIEGDLEDLTMPPKIAIGKPALLNAGSMECDIVAASAVFDDMVISTEIADDKSGPSLDVVLYKGAEKEINFTKMDQAVVVVGLSMTGRGEKSNRRPIKVSTDKDTGLLTAEWPGHDRPLMKLTVPVKPMRSTPQKKAASASLGGLNPWKAKGD